jgi:hypothetical protein
LSKKTLFVTFLEAFMDRGGRQLTPKGQMSGNGSGPAIAHLPPSKKLEQLFLY